jgi:hypothetical protein
MMLFCHNRLCGSKIISVGFYLDFEYCVSFYRNFPKKNRIHEI